MRCAKALVVTLLLFCVPAVAQQKQPVVHALLFYSPGCPHCHAVIENELPPMMERHKDQLQIVMVNIDLPKGQALFQEAMKKYSIPKSRRVVPFMIIGNTTLIGSEEIERRFPDMVEKGLAAGGEPLPNIPTLEEALDR